MKVNLFIALRYLFAKKSNNVINIISAISISGIALGTAAMILVMSVFNGFDNLIESNLEASDPDLLIVASDGSFFDPEAGDLAAALGTDGIRDIEYHLQEKVAVSLGEIQTTATARGVDSLSLFDNAGRPLCRMAEGLAANLAVNYRSEPTLSLIYPKKGKTISIANPAASMNIRQVRLYDTFKVAGPQSGELILVPTEVMRDLLGVSGNVSGVALRFGAVSPREGNRIIRNIRKALPEGYEGLTRQQQQSSIYKMLRYEKLVIFLILCLIVLIVTCTIAGCLTMLRIEKTEDMETLHALGISRSGRERIFLLEGILSSLLGVTVGTVVGTGLALLQQYGGIIRMPAGFMVQNYPVDVNAAQVLLCCAVCVFIGTAVTIISAKTYRSA